MKTSDFSYQLPEEAIAQSPCLPRENCKLAVVDRKTGSVEHTIFKEVGQHLRPGDCLVLNDSRVMAARLYCKKNQGALVEVLLTKPLGSDGKRWEGLLKPAKKVKIGEFLGLASDESEGFLLLEKTEAGTAVLEWQGNGILNVSLLEQIGLPPLPPYIRRNYMEDSSPLKADRELYQTVYAAQPGSVAAPTAGLHFSFELLNKLQRQGINICKVTLHVGLGTFLPIKTETVEEHRMHSEGYELSQSSIDMVEKTKKEGRRVVAVGTTSLRVLEGVNQKYGKLRAGTGETDLFVLPGYEFKIVDSLITNFHASQSTLLMLVSAFYSRDGIFKVYQECLEKGYRFLSYGDAMLLK